MRIESVTISGFRSFGPDGVEVDLTDDLTTVVGPNASGKTALLQAIGRVFGVTRSQRTVVRSDFHLPYDCDSNDRTARELSIDVLISIPELKKGTATPETVAPVFRHMRIERTGMPAVCRIRLEARWDDDGTAEGAITQQLSWIDTLDAKIEDKDRHSVVPADRGLIQLYYTPASRDAASQVRATTGALASRLLRAIDWSTATKKKVLDASGELRAAFEAESAIKAIAEALTTRWGDLHDEKTDTNPSLSLVSHRFEEVISHIHVLFQQGPAGVERSLEDLSDGQQSLFYFALAAAVFDLERKIVTSGVKGFTADDLTIPALTIFALEEPENHLSPYYLARIIKQVKSLIAADRAQAIITSHSPAVLSRVEPTGVRYCRCSAPTRTTKVKPLQLPEGDIEAAKFIRGAMLAFPELYFARFVVLVEGDSERIVLPKLAEALDFLVDPSFVAIAPLGGRHVNHFWKLLSDLGIPFATLLDLDIGRKDGGWGRVKIALKNLIEKGEPKAKLLKTTDGAVSDAELEEMHDWAFDAKLVAGWVSFLRKYDVYFSDPVDIDMMMLKAFPAAYASLIPKGGGPATTVEKAAVQVLKGEGKGLVLYTGGLEPYKDLLPAYNYHFLSNSKPATHIGALAALTNKEMKDDMPEPLKALLTHVNKNLRRD
jgi:putative ATP-dependent endonuclease of OLD family